MGGSSGIDSLLPSSGLRETLLEGLQESCKNTVVGLSEEIQGGNRSLHNLSPPFKDKDTEARGQ